MAELETPATAKELQQSALADIAQLEYEYYVLKSLNKETFDQQHAQRWDKYEADMAAAGYMQPPVDRQAEYAALTTATARVAYIAEVLGLA